jgi:hypothetical protein
VASDGIITSKVTTKDSVYWNAKESPSGTGPALLSHGGRLWISWAGTDGRLNLMSSADGVTFDHKVVLDERTSAQPALAVHNGRLAIAWTGGGNKINVATLAF